MGSKDVACGATPPHLPPPTPRRLTRSYMYLAGIEEKGCTSEQGRPKEAIELDGFGPLIGVAVGIGLTDVDGSDD